MGRRDGGTYGSSGDRPARLGTTRTAILQPHTASDHSLFDESGGRRSGRSSMMSREAAELQERSLDPRVGVIVLETRRGLALDCMGDASVLKSMISIAMARIGIRG